MKAVVGIIIAIIIIGGGAFALVKHNDPEKADDGGTSTSSTSQSSSDNPTTTDTQSSDSAASSSTPSTNSVEISSFAFSPANITVKKGTTVTWTNKDSVAHTVREIDGQDGPKSDDLNQNKTYSFTYDTVGTFKYNCSIHPNMIGTVTVTD